MTLDPRTIEAAIRRSTDIQSFVDELLRDTLNWPIEQDIQDPEDLGFEWSADDLRAQGLDRHLVDAQIRQLQPMDNQQAWGIFFLEFKDPKVVQSGRGLTSVLRKVVRGLVESRRKDAGLPSWKREHLLFIATHGYEYFRFAYFRAPEGNTKTAPLATFGWAPDEPVRTVCEFNLPFLEWPDDTSDTQSWVNAWAQAFDVEKVTSRFFEDYRNAFRAVETTLEGIPDDKTRRLYTQRLFNRLLFIYFIQKKGWLKYNGNANYLPELFRTALEKGEDFLNDRLYWLFFCGFNQLKGERTREDAQLLRDKCGEIPYLNGGLFAIVDHWDEQGKVNIPNDAFALLFRVLSKYNFTVTESTPWDIEVAVDPEMLGKVFEELVTGRHESGSYYTPRPVVSFMCKEALKGYLGGCETLVDDHDASAISVPEARDLLKKLAGVRVVDPACGSGAYLLGMLHELHEITQILDTRAGEGTARDDYDRKLAIIQNNLYGVDLDEFATNIARLRLWLSLAVEYGGGEPEPLPNLDFKIEAGNSVLSPNPQTAGQGDFLTGVIDRFREAKARHMRASSKDKYEREKEVKAIRDEIAHWHQGRGAGGFDWAIDFAEVFADGGFDIVLANPPYVRQELIKDIKPQLHHVYGSFYSGTADLYCYFYARALELLRPGGMLAFISSNKWFRAAYGSKLRTLIGTTCTISSITDFGDLPVFQSATAYPMVFIATKGLRDRTPLMFTDVPSLDPPYPDVRAVIALHGHELPKEAVTGGDWRLTDATTSSRIEKMKENSVPLGEYVKGQIYRGVLTGFNKAFVIDGRKRAELIEQDPNSAEIIKLFA
ncbi:MAG: Eco57I restriction-modification methylase domain-containing protein, partial [Candidatus Hydrogenedentes bacterium]|nr:Eco57I restriction-modification methylase domain-containing protein [Candidatus Hydrogenedentota bacterium]